MDYSISFGLNEFYALQCRESVLKEWILQKDCIDCFPDTSEGFKAAWREANARANKFDLEYRIIRIEWTTVEDSIRK